MFLLRDNNVNNFKRKKGRYHKNSEISKRLWFVNKNFTKTTKNKESGTKRSIYWYVIS